MHAVSMRHGGLPCVMAAERVHSAETARATDAPARLWPEVATLPEVAALPIENDRERLLRVTTSVGSRTVTASNLRLVEIGSADRFELPTLVAELIDLPFVVGLAEVDGRLAWIVDPARIGD